MTEPSRHHLSAVDLPRPAPPEAPEPPTQGPLRRHFLLQLGLAGASTGAALFGAGMALAPAAAAGTDVSHERRSGRVRPDAESPRFTVAVIPDTQYLFDGASLHPEPLAASVEAILARAVLDNVVLVAHLGDVVQNGAAGEVAAASPVFDPLSAAGMPWTVLVGNHDIDPSTDDQRGPTPWLSAFGPSRFAGAPGYSSSPGGYNSARLVRAGGYGLLVLALDWRISEIGLAWAQQTIEDHPRSPVLLTIHELVNADAPDAPAVLSDFGRGVFDRMVAGNDEIFLTLRPPVDHDAALGDLMTSPPQRAALGQGAPEPEMLTTVDDQGASVGCAPVTPAEKLDDDAADARPAGWSSATTSTTTALRAKSSTSSPHATAPRPARRTSLPVTPAAQAPPRGWGTASGPREHHQLRPHADRRRRGLKTDHHHGQRQRPHQRRPLGPARLPLSAHRHTPRPTAPYQHLRPVHSTFKAAHALGGGRDGQRRRLDLTGSGDGEGRDVIR